LTCGFGGSVLFTTYAFAGVYYALWTPLTVFTVMIATVMFVLVCAYRYALRLLMNVSLFGGTLAPLSLRPETDQVFALFLYMLVLNAGVFFIAIQKKVGRIYVARQYTGFVDVDCTRCIRLVCFFLGYVVYVAHVHGIWLDRPFGRCG
jgi:hypothetical protein